MDYYQFADHRKDRDDRRVQIFQRNCVSRVICQIFVNVYFACLVILFDFTSFGLSSIYFTKKKNKYTAFEHVIKQ